MKLLQSSTLIAATLTSGLTAGLFFSFTNAVMPGLKHSSDRAYVEVMQNINKDILNPWFMTCFMGGLAFAATAVVVHWRADDHSALPWIIAGFAFFLAMFIITSAVNVPLNDDLKNAGDPAKIADLAAVRNAFEDKWVLWNTIRTVANVASFGCFAWALVLFGRAAG